MEAEQADSGQAGAEDSGATAASGVERAAYALALAAELLQSADRKNSESDYADVIALSRDCMRVASSAVLFLDDKVAPDLETSCTYLRERYGDAFQVSEWQEVERLSGTGLAARVAGIFGIGAGKERLQKDAEKALQSAARFFGAASAIVGEQVKEQEGAAEEGGEQEGGGQGELAQEEEEQPAGPEEELFGEAS
jgi:hypothetical protein